MKRALFENVKVVPFSPSLDIIDRENFLSLIVAAKSTEGGTLTFTVTHSDAEDGTFTPATDMRLEANDKGTFTTGGVITVPGVPANGIINVDIDVVGCKRFLKVTGGGNSNAYALGDATYAPV